MNMETVIANFFLGADCSFHDDVHCFLWHVERQKQGQVAWLQRALKASKLEANARFGW